jgi:hypothetical protein
VICAALCWAENRLKLLCVKIAVINIVTGLDQVLNYEAMKRALKAILGWMRVDY